MRTGIIISIAVIIVAGALTVYFGFQLQPEHYTIEIQGMKDVYEPEEPFSFYYTLTGFGNTCHSWTVAYPDVNGATKQMGEAVDCHRPSNKELDYDSRKELRKFSSLAPKFEGRYNVTVWLENIKPTTFEFSVVNPPIQCEYGFKEIDGKCQQLGEVQESDIPVFFYVQLMELGIDWELADRSWANPDFEIEPPARVCSHIIKEDGAEAYVSTIWVDEYTLSDMEIVREMPSDCVKVLPIEKIR